MDTEERRRISGICLERARDIINIGDRVGCTKCPGTKRVFTFERWDGRWMVSKTGIDDYSPYNIYSINGEPIDLRANA